jgi:hypothetical protein
MSVVWFKPKVIYVIHVIVLKHWTRRPVEDGAPDTKYLATCAFCGGHSQVSYNYMCKYGEFDCEHCHCRCQGPTLVPDPGTVYGFGRCYHTRIILN